ncbi:MAG: GGDEF domain-containing protein [Elusimicrobiota bacterium]
MFWSKEKEQLKQTESNWARFSEAVKNVLSAQTDDKRVRAMLNGVMSITNSTRGLVFPLEEAEFDELEKSIISVGITDEEMKILFRLSTSDEVTGEMTTGNDKWYFHPVVYKNTPLCLIIVDNSLEFRELSLEKRQNLSTLNSKLSTFLSICGVVLSYNRLKEVSLKDALTGLHTRAFFEEQLYSAIRRARRVGTSFGMIMIDIDNFKQVNESFGHPVGDEVLRRVASELRGSVKDIDNVGRLGGEEFGIIIDDADEEITLAVAERLCSEVAKLDTTALIKRNLTISCGVSVWRKGLMARDLLAMSDNALRQAKQQGKNQAIAYKIKVEGRKVEG